MSLLILVLVNFKCDDSSKASEYIDDVLKNAPLFDENAYGLKINASEVKNIDPADVLEELKKHVTQTEGAPIVFVCCTKNEVEIKKMQDENEAAMKELEAASKDDDSYNFTLEIQTKKGNYEYPMVGNVGELKKRLADDEATAGKNSDEKHVSDTAEKEEAQEEEDETLFERGGSTFVEESVASDEGNEGQDEPGKTIEEWLQSTHEDESQYPFSRLVLCYKTI